ncbi:MAG: hypothetical protein WC756_16115 [Taibaiella sp.]|jgi:transketolase
MRVEFAQAIINQYTTQSQQVFITGDLGYMALEKVRETFGNRFINAGVAEQNMVSMAAAMAYEGFIPWVYSISPFVTLRPYEQIRNDACIHNLPVKLVGNGGGYGYGIMGATHHNLEDIAAMRVLPNMKVYVPFTGNDVAEVVALMLQDKAPNYLRLNQAREMPGIPPFAAWRCIKKGTGAVVAGTGPVVANIFNLPEEILAPLEIWVIGIFPIENIPEEFLETVKRIKKVITIEEHYAAGGLGEHLAALLLKEQLNVPLGWHSLHANGYPNGRYGSQQWHQELNGLSGQLLQNKIASIL